MKFNVVSPAWAAGPIELGKIMTLKNGQTVADTYDKPGTVVNLIVSNLFVVTGLVIFALVIMAGFHYLQDSSKGVEEAKKLISGAIVGLLVMLSAYWIVQIIKAITGADIPI